MVKRLFCLGLMLFASLSLPAKDQVYGPQGRLSVKVTLPKDFDPKTDHCPMVILMHGIFSSKDFIPMPSIAKGLAREGIASVRFDFDGHGRSQGRMQDMTVEKEIADAMAIWKYVRALPYVTDIGLLGHSQGGVIASMVAGRLAAGKDGQPAGLVLIAPGSVIKDACRGGKFFEARFDPADPPEYVRCWKVMKLGREYLLSTQTLDIFGTARAYTGPVRLLHGTQDHIVPMKCSRQYLETYGQQAELIQVEGENHMITKKRSQVVALTVSFFKEVFSL